MDTEPAAERERELTEARAFLAALGSPLDQSKPRRLLDVNGAVRLLAEVRSQVATIAHIEAENAVGRRDLFRVLGEMARVVELYVEDPAVREKIKAAWQGIRLA